LAEETFFVQHIAPIDTIKTWTSSPTEWRESTLIGQLAPKLETLHINIGTPSLAAPNGPPVSIVKLGPALKSVDVVFDMPGGGMLLVKGWPAKDLVHMRIDARYMRLQTKLYEWLQTKQMKPLVCAEHCSSDADDVRVILQQTTEDAKLILRFDLPST